MKIDLHNHTTYSDGKLKPEELVGLKIKLGIDLIGITDHYEDIKDIDNYFDELNALAQNYKDKIIIIPGIEKEFMGQHVIIFGESYIREKHVVFTDYMEKFPSGEHDHCFILAHPDIDNVNEKLLSLMHAVEVSIYGFIHPEYTLINTLTQGYNLKKFAVSDTHDNVRWSETYTEFHGLNIRTEKELISFIKSRNSYPYKFNIWVEFKEQI